MEKSAKQAPDVRGKARMITEEMRKEFSHLKTYDMVVLESSHTYGQGIGAEPYGYKLTKLVTLVSLSLHTEQDESKCPECGSRYAIETYSSGRATCSPSGLSLECDTCSNELYSEFRD